jgi:transcriptional regulator GlxA family with amidase domain
MRRIVILTFPGGQSLDVTGPLEVFAATRRFGPSAHCAVEVVAPRGGAVPMGSGLQLVAEQSIARVRGPVDTFLVAGGSAAGIARLVGDDATLHHVRRIADGARRVASVCSGAFVLAAAGLLDGRHATTHWSACEALAAAYPSVIVERDPIFVRDGQVWTSAGVTAGIDLALALVEDDAGHDVAMAIARRLVVFLKRPGGQAQFSSALAGQTTDRDDLGETLAWIADHLDADLSVPALAARVAMSSRHFARIFRSEIGTTPARHVEGVRLEAARRRLEETDAGVETIAHGCGFGTAETMRRVFLRTLHVTPTDYRRLHGGRADQREAS